MRTTLRRSGIAAVVLGVALGAAACSSGSSGGTSATSAASTSSMASSAAAVDSSSATTMTFGAGCAAVPTSGSGSFQGMAQDPVATAASNNPALSTLVTAVKAAGLVDTLNSADGVTVFAPTNDAFAAMDQATLKKALADPKGLLSTVLTYHVVSGRLSPEMLAGTHKTLQGTTLTVKGSGEDFTVNGAKVVCGNVQTANATVYLVDGVLSPAA
jgi:uncharacterized surface protein with fasciclin (FAS1) repeats